MTEDSAATPNDLPIPPELQHLIEKRQGEERRQEERRDEQKLNLEPNGTADSAEDIEEVPSEDHNAQPEQRRRIRRRKLRREEDA
jgi:hypothetical protein